MILYCVLNICGVSLKYLSDKYTLEISLCVFIKLFYIYLILVLYICICAVIFYVLVHRTYEKKTYQSKFYVWQCTMCWMFILYP